MTGESERRLIIDIGRLLYESRFIAGSDGNLSIRMPDNTIMITPSGFSKGFLKEADMVTVDLEGNLLSGHNRPSSELPMHLFVYQNRPDIGACCHAHPPYSTAFSVVGKVLPSNILPEVILTLGEIPLTAYAPPGTMAVPESLREYIDNHVAFMLRNHGILTIGRTLEEAFARMETVEHYARIVYIAEKSGQPNFLDFEEVRRLEKIRDSHNLDKTE
jgi:L-fuculose-phosphate aldolase